jgi:predicted dehydrogenase
MPHIEIYGTEGSISTPDPNGFGGPVRVKAAGEDAWREVTVEGPYSQNSRGLGVLDMAHAIRRGREARASGALAYHVLDVMQAILESAESGSRISIASSVSRPDPIPVDAPEDDLPG